MADNTTSLPFSGGIKTHKVYVSNIGPRGKQGEPGKDGRDGISEEDMTYSKRTDFINDYLLYRGEAPVGTLNTTALWRIRRITIGFDGDVTEEWANGNASFMNAWTDRTTLEYS